MIDLPKCCLVNRFIPKKTFYEKIAISSNIKDEFVNEVEKIIWLYKLSEDTLGISKTEVVEEIQVFEIYLKEKKIPKNVIKIISKAIPYKILFVIKYNDNICYGIKVDDLYFSDWNEKIIFELNSLNLEIVYENMVKSIMKESETEKEFENLIQDRKKEEELTKKIETIKNKISKEKQFNRKVELNQELRKLEKEMEKLNNE